MVNLPIIIIIIIQSFFFFSVWRVATTRCQKSQNYKTAWKRRRKIPKIARQPLPHLKKGKGKKRFTGKNWTSSPATNTSNRTGGKKKEIRRKKGENKEEKKNKGRLWCKRDQKTQKANPKDHSRDPVHYYQGALELMGFSSLVPSFVRRLFWLSEQISSSCCLFPPTPPHRQFRRPISYKLGRQLFLTTPTRQRWGGNDCDTPHP
jgi:hypothetical protein